MSTAMNALRNLRARTPATGLVREFYTDAALFDLDLDLIFYREWLFAAHTAELPQTGSYLTLQVGAYPIVVVRGADGIIRAFVNSCRHRGSRVCRTDHGVARKLVCPYHQWTYDSWPEHFPIRPTVTGVSGAGSDPAIVAHWARCDARGLPSGFQLSEDGQCRTTRMPLLGEAVSYTGSGQPAVQRALSDEIPCDAQIGALLAFHYPSTWDHVLVDHAISFRVLPLGPARTQLTTKWLVHREAVENVDYRLDDLTAVWRATNEQDRKIVEENQIGVSSPTYQPGPYSYPQESGVSQFVDWYCERLGPRLE